MSIPVQNIYYLLSYAWNVLDKEENTQIDAIPGDNLVHLLAYLLQKDGALLIKKGLAKQYIRQTEIIQGIKGKIEIGISVRDDLFRRGKAACTFETLSADILPNQIIKTALHQLLRCPALHPDLQGPLRLILTALKEVSLIAAIKAQDYEGIVTSGSFNIYYRRVLPVCELLLQNLLPQEEGNKYLFTSFLEDEQQMGRLFEAFVRNFYGQEQHTFAVKSERINWQLEEATATDLQYLPQMKTDISLTAVSRKIIIDTKYYKKALIVHYDKQKLIAGHLYQLFAYLKNQTDKTNSVEGILLYPVVNQELDLEYKLPGHKVSIKTINLAQPWQDIKADLLRVIA